MQSQENELAEAIEKSKAINEAFERMEKPLDESSLDINTCNCNDTSECNCSSDISTNDNDKKEGVTAESYDLVKENAILKAQIENLEKKAKEDKDLMLRALAEAENSRKRAEADVVRERKYALEKFVKSLIPVVDSLDRALELTDRNDPSTKATIEGVESTLNLFLKELASFGVERIDPTGQAFDPNVHQAISMVESADVKPNHVLSTMQKGFLLNGRVVRAAMVVVAKAPKTE